MCATNTFTVEIATTCTWFQKRLCWMMSSILQQKGNVPNLIFNIGYPVENGDPSTEKVCEYFRSRGLQIREVPFDGMEMIQYRGLARNKQLEVATGNWILFADTDMAYDEYFFEDLARQLQGELRDEERCLSASRVSLDKDFCKNYFNEADPFQGKYPIEIPNVSEQLKQWPIYQVSRSCGAGYFQLVHIDVIRGKLGNLYVEPERCADWGWDKMQKAKSDRQFRKRVGGIRRIKTKPQYHLNHERDNEAGHHLTWQR